MRKVSRRVDDSRERKKGERMGGGEDIEREERVMGIGKGDRRVEQGRGVEDRKGRGR